MPTWKVKIYCILVMTAALAKRLYACTLFGTSCMLLFLVEILQIYTLTAKLFNLNFHPLEVVSRWRDPQLQVSENYSALTRWRSTLFKSCWLMSHFKNIFKMWYLIKNENPNIFGTGGKKVKFSRWICTMFQTCVDIYRKHFFCGWEAGTFICEFSCFMLYSFKMIFAHVWYNTNMSGNC